MKAVFRVYSIVAVILLGISLVGAFVLRFTIWYASYDGISAVLPFVMIIAMLYLFSCYFAYIASVVMLEILVYVRFYKNFFSDEGYLTFTLPATRKQLFTSKFLNAMIWQVLHLIVLLICALFYCGISPVPENGGIFSPVAFQWIGETVGGFFAEVGAWGAVYILEAILLLIAVAAFSVALVHFCITVGSIIAKKGKIFAALGLYFGIESVLSTVISVAVVLLSILLADGFLVLTESLSAAAGRGVVALLLGIVIAAISALAGSLHCWTQSLLERKLNLA